MSKRNTIHKQAQRAVSLSGKHCADCGSTSSLDRHHPDYSQSTLVVIVCRQCHRRRDESEGKWNANRRTERPCVICQTPFMPTHSTNRTCKKMECRRELGRLNALKRWHPGVTSSARLEMAAYRSLVRSHGQRLLGGS